MSCFFITATKPFKISVRITLCRTGAACFYCQETQKDEKVNAWKSSPSLLRESHQTDNFPTSVTPCPAVPLRCLLQEGGSNLRGEPRARGRESGRRCRGSAARQASPQPRGEAGQRGQAGSDRTEPSFPGWPTLHGPRCCLQKGLSQKPPDPTGHTANREVLNEGFGIP